MGKGRRNSSCGKDKKKKKAGPSGPDGTRPAILALEKQQHDHQEFTAILRDWHVRSQPGPCETLSQKNKTSLRAGSKVSALAEDPSSVPGTPVMWLTNPLTTVPEYLMPSLGACTHDKYYKFMQAHTYMRTF